MFQTVLDAVFLTILLVLLAYYSTTLTAVVLGFALAIAGCIAALLPVFRRRLTALYMAEAAKQAHLVETLHNMRAVKALVLARQQGWERSLVDSMRRQWSVGVVSAFASAATGWMETLMQVSVLGLGASSSSAAS